MIPPSPTLTRYRVSYTRGPEMRYVSLLDLQLVWERTFRRSGLPVAYSQGFSPHPRFHMASPLPLGFTSRCELADIWLNEPLPTPKIGSDLQEAAPPGLTIDCVEEVPLSLPALQTLVRVAEYEAAFPFSDPLPGQEQAEPPAALTGSTVAEFLRAESILRERRGKQYDLRPLVEVLELCPDGTLFMRLSARESATARPEEVLSALGLDPSQARVERTRLILAD